MTRIKIRELIWDKYNVEHIKKHNVTVGEAEEAVKNFIKHKAGKKREIYSDWQVWSKVNIFGG